MPDDACSNCFRPLQPTDFGFLCDDCACKEAAIQAARLREADAKACKLRMLGLTPGLHRDDAVAHAGRE